MARVPDTTIARYYGSRAKYAESLQRTIDALTGKQAVAAGPELAELMREVAELQKQKADNQ